MLEIIFAIVCVVLAIISLIISVMSFKEKGFLFNNAYIWALSTGWLWIVVGGICFILLVYAIKSSIKKI